MKFVLSILCCSVLLISGSCSKGKSKTSNSKKTSNQIVAVDAWEAKRLKGVDFVALGNEPSWGIDVGANQTIQFFKAGDRDTLVLPVPVLTKDASGTFYSYKGETEKGMLHLIIRDEECSDKMSDSKYYYSTQVKVRRGNESKVSEYFGCGIFLNDYRLNDVFALYNFNGQDLKPEEFPTGVPYIEINLHESKIRGKAGCNTFNGKLKAVNNFLSIGPLMTTRMACSQLKLESEIIDALSGKTLLYSFGKEGLIIHSDQSTLKFRKVE